MSDVKSISAVDLITDCEHRTDKLEIFTNIILKCSVMDRVKQAVSPYSISIHHPIKDIFFSLLLLVDP